MAEEKKKFRVSFRCLLSEIIKALGWPQAMYSHANLNLNQSNLVLHRGPGPAACLFKGEKNELMWESEEHAAEQDVDYLVKKKQVIVEDFNLEGPQKYKAVCNFYQQKRDAMRYVEWVAGTFRVMYRRQKKMVVPKFLPVRVTADLWDIWLQVVVSYNVIVDEMDFITQPDGRYVYCFTVVWPKEPARERYFISDSKETVDKARQSLARKAITYFQTIYGFTVKDANFNRMLYCQIQCGFQRGRYRSVKAKQICVASNLESVPMFIAEGASTPEGDDYGIRSGLTIPLPPKKPKVKCRNNISGASLNAGGTVSNSVASPLLDAGEEGSSPY